MIVGRLALLVVAAVVVVAPAARASEATDCWTETVQVGLSPQQVTICLLEGGALEVYASATEPPRMIDINLGYDALGTECWWSTSYETPWVKVGVDGNGIAQVGYRPEGAPETVLDALVPPCTSRPQPTDTVLALAWELANRHVHERPDPFFSPDVGITGLETFLELAVPAPVTDSLVSPVGTTVTVEIRVAAVEVKWGDGEAEVYTETLFPNLTGYPDGVARHVYETKTCPTPGGPRCHPSLPEYEIEVAFDWFVRWQIDTGPWSTIDVPSSVAFASYDVDEVVTRSVATP